MLKAVCVASALVAGALGATPAFAQRPTITLDELGLSQAQFDALIAEHLATASSPGIAFGSPVAFGAGWGEIGFGVGGTTLPKRSRADVDGSFGVVFGLGDPNRYVGLETSVNLISLRRSFGDDGNVGLKLHTVLPGSAAFAIGVDNIGRWGRAKFGSSSVYAVGTKIFRLAPNSSNVLPLSVNLGIGDNRFSDLDHPNASVFGGLAFFPIRQLSLIADYSERSVNAGVSVAPFSQIPATLTVGATNLTKQDQGTQFGRDTEFTAAVGYSVRF
ncbi:MAG TPA: hypothetical protein VM074_04365 [Solimonas sp.]|nr:hypothetical protein [Solimonas sp.]